MTKPTPLIVLGLLTALMPFIGIPGSWKTILLVVFGLGIALIGFLHRRNATQGAQHDTFVESNNGTPVHG